MVKKIVRLILSAFITISSIIVLILRVFVGVDFYTNKIIGFNAAYLKYFTSLSNFYNGFVFLAIFIISLINYKNDDYKFSKIMKVITLSATSSVSITFFITISFLNFSLPDPLILYQKELLFFHVLNPLISIFIFLFLLPGEKISIKECLFGAIPLVSYSIAYSILIITQIWDDHYNFTFGGHYWVIAIAFPVVLGISFLINWGLSLLEGKIKK